MEENSVLKCTYELSVENKLPFLDAMITVKGLRFESSVYRKPTDAGKNGKSECPSRYRKNVIRAFIRRATKCCSSWDLLHVEFERLKQILVNNGFTNSEIDFEIKQHIFDGVLS